MIKEAKMVGDTVQNRANQIERKELIAWIDTIPFSKSMKNLRDFSDAVLMAEILKLYYPRYVELHNYVPTSNVNMKMENWDTLNRKVLTKIDMKLNKNIIYHLANASQITIEKLLSEMRMKILRDGKEMHKPKCMKNNLESTDVQMSEEEKIGDSSPQDDQFNLSREIPNKYDTINEIRQFDLSRFKCLQRGIFNVFNWITYLFRIWSVFSYCIPRFRKRKEFVNVPEQLSENDATVPYVIYDQLKREQREKEEIICTLNHKIIYLESSMKLKDLRISSLTAQILQNAVEMNHRAMSQSNDNARVKLRSRSHNLQQEAKTN